MNIFDQARKDFENAYNSMQYQLWRKQAKEAFNFYEGNQYNDEEKEQLLNTGQIPVVINKIKPRLDNIAAIEIRQRNHIRFKSRSGKAHEKLIANGLSDLAYFQQNKEDTAHKLSQIAHQARICGIGWHIFEPSAHEINEFIGNPFEFIWDVTDFSEDLSESSYICRMIWVDKKTAIAKFPQCKDKINNLTTSKYECDNDFYINNNNKILIVEYQYKKPAYYFEVITKDGNIVETIDEKEAINMAQNKKSIYKRNGFKLYSAYFSGNINLKHIEHQQQFDFQKGSFLYTPYILQREINSGTPYGLVRGAIMPQRLYNKKSAKLVWLMSSRQIIAEANVTSNWHQIAHQAARPDGIILVDHGKINNIKFSSHGQEINAHSALLHQHDKEIQDALGIYNESLGIATNANSGAAIKNRQAGSVNNHALPLDRLRAMKRKYGLKLLKLIRCVFTHEIAFNIIDDANQAKAIKLNQVTQQRSIINDVRIGQYDLYLKEVNDNATQTEEAQEKIIELLKANIKLTPGMLELFGVPKSMQIYNELIT